MSLPTTAADAVVLRLSKWLAKVGFSIDQHLARRFLS